MKDQSPFDLYTGRGTPLSKRNPAVELPPFRKVDEFDHPAGYVAEDGLRDAVNVALSLGQPLLVTGEPGTGKTQLAATIAHELELPPPLVFNTKTNFVARDLFYQYDSLRHFQDAHLRNLKLDVEQYITYEALGLAILLSSKEQVPTPTRSVVLIDEIDKAPRDLPNDVLNEIENMAFTVKETRRVFWADQGYRPIVVLTSNSEKNLPDAFLRRVVFYHIEFPNEERLKEIVRRRLGDDGAFTPAMLENAIAHFIKIRDLGLKKQPATAEFLAWLRIIRQFGIDVAKLKRGDKEKLAFSYSILSKNFEDAKKLGERFIGK